MTQEQDQIPEHHSVYKEVLETLAQQPTIEERKQDSPAAAGRKPAKPKEPKEEPIPEEQELSYAAFGWKFPTVKLSSTDDKVLLEHEVKLQMRVEPKDIILYCTYFTEHLVCDFPPEVFLQRPGIIKHLLRLLHLPIYEPLDDDSDDQTIYSASNFSFGESFYGYRKKDSSLCVFFSALRAIETLVSRLFGTFTTNLDTGLHVNPTRLASSISQMAYPPSNSSPRKEVDGWSFFGFVYMVLCTVIPLLTANHYPKAQVLAMISQLIERLKELNEEDTSIIDIARFNDVLRLFETCKPLYITSERQRILAFPDYSELIYLNLLIELTAIFPPSCYTRVQMESPEKIYIGPAVLQAIQEACRDEALYLVKPSVRERLLSLFRQVDPNTVQAIENTRLVKSKFDACIEFLSDIREFIQSPEKERSDFEITEYYEKAQDALLFLESHEKSSDILSSLLTLFLLTFRRMEEQCISLFSQIYAHPVLKVRSDFIGLLMVVLEQDKHVTESEYLVHLLSQEERNTFVSKILLDARAMRTFFIHFFHTDRDYRQLIVTKYLRELQPAQVLPYVPYLQQVAYSSKGDSSTREYLVNILCDLDSIMDQRQRLLSMIRCLFHEDKEYRSSASHGIFHYLQSLSNHVMEEDNDPFGQVDDLAESIECRFSRSSSRKTKPVAEESIEKLLGIVDSKSQNTSIRKSALDQLMIYCQNSSVAVESVVASNILQLLESDLRQERSPNHFSSLSLLAVLTCEHQRIRTQVKSSIDWFCTILPFLYSPQHEYREPLYCILLALALGSENYAPIAALQRVTIPTSLETFTLLQHIWKDLGIEPLSVMEEYCIESYETQKPIDASALKQFIDPKEMTSLLFQHVVSAKSHRSFLNRMYYLTQLCRVKGSEIRQQAAQMDWYSTFERFFNEKPTSWQDETVLNAILELLQLFSSESTIDQGLRLVVLTKDIFIPLLSIQEVEFRTTRRTRQSILKLISSLGRELSDFVQALTLDTALIDILSCLYLPADSADVPLQRVAIDITSCCTVGFLNRVHIEKDHIQLHSKWDNHMRMIIPQLVMILSHHRSPDTFQDKALVLQALDCLNLAIQSTTAVKDMAFYSDISLQSNTRPIHEYMAWCTRFALDRDARVRMLAFSIFGHLHSSEDITQDGLISMAMRTLQDTSECAAVKGQAVTVLRNTISVCEALQLVESDLHPSFIGPVLDILSTKRADFSLRQATLSIFYQLISPVFLKTQLNVVTPFYERMVYTVSHQALNILSSHLISCNINRVLAILFKNVQAYVETTDPSIEYQYFIEKALLVWNNLLILEPDAVVTNPVEQVLSKLIDPTTQPLRIRLGMCPVLYALAIEASEESTISHDLLELFTREEIELTLEQRRICGLTTGLYVSKNDCAHLISHCIDFIESQLSVLHFEPTSKEAYDLIVIYLDTLSVCVLPSATAQEKACELRLPATLDALWKYCTSRPRLMDSMLGLVINIMCHNSSTTRSIMCETRIIRELVMLKKNSVTSKTFQVLASLLKLSEGRTFLVKCDFVTKCVAFLNKTVRFDQKVEKCEMMLTFLIHISMTRDHLLIEKCLQHELLMDLLHSPNLSNSALVFIRNLSFSKNAKRCFVSWPNFLVELFNFLPNRSIAMTLWSLAYDNEKGKAALSMYMSKIRQLRDELEFYENTAEKQDVILYLSQLVTIIT